MANDYSYRVKNYSPRLKSTGVSAVEDVKVTGYFKSKQRFCGDKIGRGKAAKNGNNIFYKICTYVPLN